MRQDSSALKYFNFLRHILLFAAHSAFDLLCRFVKRGGLVEAGELILAFTRGLPKFRNFVEINIKIGRLELEFSHRLRLRYGIVAQINPR